MTVPKRGEVRLADLGMAAKVRPVFVVGVPYGGADYTLVGVVPHTSTPHGLQFEVALTVSWWQAGAFNVQGMLAVPVPKFLRKLGSLDPAQLQ